MPPTYAVRRWKMGGYIRLSKEDLQKINRGLDDSNSVKNQCDILNDFHFNHAEKFESYTEYVGDGHTGTDTERESFQRLLGDVMNGKITRYKQLLYQDWKDGEITQQEYRDMKADYERQAAELSDLLTRLIPRGDIVLEPTLS